MKQEKYFTVQSSSCFLRAIGGVELSCSALCFIQSFQVTFLGCLGCFQLTQCHETLFSSLDFMSLKAKKTIDVCFS